MTDHRLQLDVLAAPTSYPALKAELLDALDTMVNSAREVLDRDAGDEDAIVATTAVELLAGSPQRLSLSLALLVVRLATWEPKP